MLEDAEAPVLITERKLAANLPATRAKVVCLEDVLERPATDGETANLPQPGNAGSPCLRDLHVGDDGEAERFDDYSSQRRPAVPVDPTMVRVRRP